MLYSWVKGVVIYLILASLFISLSPSGHYKKYISFFSGLVMIILVMQPLAYILNLGRGDLDSMTRGINSYLKYTSDVNEPDDIYDYYEMSFGESIKYFLKDRGYEVLELSLITDDADNIISITIYVSYDESQPNAELEIKNYLFDVYNLSNDSIYIIRR